MSREFHQSTLNKLLFGDQSDLLKQKELMRIRDAVQMIGHKRTEQTKKWIELTTAADKDTKDIILKALSEVIVTACEKELDHSRRRLLQSDRDFLTEIATMAKNHKITAAGVLEEVATPINSEEYYAFPRAVAGRITTHHTSPNPDWDMGETVHREIIAIGLTKSPIVIGLWSSDRTGIDDKQSFQNGSNLHIAVVKRTAQTFGSRPENPDITYWIEISKDCADWLNNELAKHGKLKSEYLAATKP